MSLMTYTSRGVVLFTRDIGEADRVVTIFSDKFGKKALLAKGVRKLSSRKRGHLKPFNCVTFTAVSGKSMDLITETTSLNEFGVIGTSLNKMTLAFYICEIVAKTTNEGEPNSEVFDHLMSTLSRIEASKKLKEVRLDFVVGLLEILGYIPKNEVFGDPFVLLENVIEKQVYSERVGKRVLQ